MALLSLMGMLIFATPGFSDFYTDGDTPSEKPYSSSLNSEEPTDSAVAVAPNPSADTEDFTGFNEELPGLGAFFNTMLDALIGLTTASERRIQTLVEHFPLVFADLYRVFITL